MRHGSWWTTTLLEGDSVTATNGCTAVASDIVVSLTAWVQWDLDLMIKGAFGSGLAVGGFKNFMTVREYRIRQNMLLPGGLESRTILATHEYTDCEDGSLSCNMG